MGSDRDGIGLGPMGVQSRQSEDAQASPTEAIRRSHKPKRVTVLLVGEAPPSNGTFFYRCDSNLFRYTKDAFAEAFGLQFHSGSDFLVFFRDRGFFLDDLTPRPVDKVRGVRRSQRQAAVGSLAIRMRGYNPKHVIVVMKGIEPHVRQAASLAAIPKERIHVLPFPTHGNQGRYVQRLVAVLHSIEPAIGALR